MIEHDSIIKDYSIINYIDRGTNGYIFTCNKINNPSKFALKITDKSLNNLSIQFFKSMYKTNKTHFMKLYDYFPYNNHYIQILSLVDLTLYNLIKTNNDKLDEIIFDLILQIFYILTLIIKNNYYYTDLKPSNIGLKKTKKKTIKIFDMNIKTHGYYVILLDYDIIKSNIIDLELNQLKIFNEFLFVLGKFYNIPILNNLLKLHITKLPKQPFRINLFEYTIINYWNILIKYKELYFKS
jgi:serine/threonine protein kinase